MKCVCPMGGNRTCPDDCPLAIWANLSASDRKAQRKSVAEKLYSQGFTMEQIATQLGVSHPTISNDLREFVKDLQIKNPAKTERNPKGAGRPKGQKNSNQPKSRRVARRPEPIISDPTKEINEFHKELVGFLNEFSRRFTAWCDNAPMISQEGKAALMEAFYICSDGLARLAQTFDGR